MKESYNHEQHNEENIVDLHMHVIRQDCKRKAEGDVGARPNKIFRQSIVNHENLLKSEENTGAFKDEQDAELGPEDVTNLRKSIYKSRRIHLPSNPKSLQESLEQLNTMEV